MNCKGTFGEQAGKKRDHQKTDDIPGYERGFYQCVGKREKAQVLVLALPSADVTLHIGRENGHKVFIL